MLTKCKSSSWQCSFDPFNLNFNFDLLHFSHFFSSFYRLLILLSFHNFLYSKLHEEHFTQLQKWKTQKIDNNSEILIWITATDHWLIENVSHRRCLLNNLFFMLIQCIEIEQSRINDHSKSPGCIVSGKFRRFYWENWKHGNELN